MRVGVSKEIKNNEFRVGLVPASVRELTNQGHEVFVETNAGMGIGVSDDDYVAVGAQILADAQSVFERAEMVVKVADAVIAKLDHISGASDLPTGGTAVTARAEGNKLEQPDILPTPPPLAPPAKVTRRAASAALRALRPCRVGQPRHHSSHSLSTSA